MEQIFQENEDGVIENPNLNLVWEDLSIALPTKVNGCGMFIDKLSRDIAYLKDLKAQIPTKIEAIENKIKRFKKDLNFLCQEHGGEKQKLEGGLYSFTAKTSEKMELDETKVEADNPNWKYSFPELTRIQFLAIWTNLINTFPDLAKQLEPNIRKRINKTDLGETHPAITMHYEPTVTVGKSRKKLEELSPELVEA